MKKSLLFVVAFMFGQVLFAQEAKTVCRPKPAGNTYISEGETVVGSGPGAQICHLEASTIVEAKRAATAINPSSQKCLIVEVEKRNLLPHLGDAPRIYRDSFNLGKKEIRSKYSESQITKLLRSGVHVVVLNAGEQTDSREACQQ